MAVTFAVEVDCWGLSTRLRWLAGGLTATRVNGSFEPFPYGARTEGEIEATNCYYCCFRCCYPVLSSVLAMAFAIWLVSFVLFGVWKPT